MNICPVCGYAGLEFPPKNFSICACCGTEFGYDDRMLTHAELTEAWINGGFRWFDVDEQKPQGWNPYNQLYAAKLDWAIATFARFEFAIATAA
jgi:hypothetical protein